MVCLELLNGVVLPLLQQVSKQVLALLRLVVHDRDDINKPINEGAFKVARLEESGGLAKMAREVGVLETKGKAMAARYKEWEEGIEKLRYTFRIRKAMELERLEV